MIKVFFRHPVARIVIVDLLRELAPEIRIVLATQGQEMANQFAALLAREGRGFRFNLLETHGGRLLDRSAQCNVGLHRFITALPAVRVRLRAPFGAELHCFTEERVVFLPPDDFTPHALRLPLERRRFESRQSALHFRQLFVMSQEERMAYLSAARARYLSGTKDHVSQEESCIVREEPPEK